MAVRAEIGNEAHNCLPHVHKLPKQAQQPKLQQGWDILERYGADLVGFWLPHNHYGLNTGEQNIMSLKDGVITVSAGKAAPGLIPSHYALIGPDGWAPVQAFAPDYPNAAAMFEQMSPALLADLHCWLIRTGQTDTIGDGPAAAAL